MTLLARIATRLHLPLLFGGAASVPACAACAAEPEPVVAETEVSELDALLDRMKALVPALGPHDLPHRAPVSDMALMELKILADDLVNRPVIETAAKETIDQVASCLRDRSPEQALNFLRPVYVILDDLSPRETVLRPKLLQHFHWLGTSKFVESPATAEAARRFVLGSRGIQGGIHNDTPAIAALVECIREVDCAYKRARAAAAISAAP